MSRTTPLILLVLVIYAMAFGQNNREEHTTETLFAQWEKAINAEDRIQLYQELVHFYNEHEYEQKHIQVLSDKAIEWAEATYDPQIIRQVYLTYFNNTPNNYADPKLPERAIKGVQHGRGNRGPNCHV